jgi:hypothetical protein
MCKRPRASQTASFKANLDVPFCLGARFASRSCSRSWAGQRRQLRRHAKHACEASCVEAFCSAAGPCHSADESVSFCPQTSNERTPIQPYPAQTCFPFNATFVALDDKLARAGALADPLCLAHPSVQAPQNPQQLAAARATAGLGHYHITRLRQVRRLGTQRAMRGGPGGVRRPQKSCVTEDELYTRQMVSPSRLATLSTVSSGKERSGGTGTVLVTITCAPAARSLRAGSPVAPGPGSRHLDACGVHRPRSLPVRWRALPFVLGCWPLCKGAMPFTPESTAEVMRKICQCSVPGRNACTGYQESVYPAGAARPVSWCARAQG